MSICPECTNPHSKPGTFCSKSCACRWSIKRRSKESYKAMSEDFKQRAFNKPKIQRVAQEKVCPRCKSKHQKDGVYCSHSCANSRGTTIKETKQVLCFGCKKEIEVGKRASKVYCEECSKPICPICGEKECLRKDVCEKKYLIQHHLSRFGFDLSTLGSSKAYAEWDRIKEQLRSDYFDKEMSIPELKAKYNAQSADRILFYFGLAYRDLSTANLLSASKHPLPKPLHSKYKCGWHLSWEGKKFFYRSSYELKLAKDFDAKQIRYEIESLRIRYFDSQENCFRTAFPDFYLPELNKIIEVKSSWTYDPVNMQDREKAFREAGYDFELYMPD